MAGRAPELPEWTNARLRTWTIAAAVCGWLLVAAAFAGFLP